MIRQRLTKLCRPIPFRDEVGGGHDDIVFCPDDDGDLPDARRLQDLHQQLQRLLKMWEEMPSDLIIRDDVMGGES